MAASVEPTSIFVRHEPCTRCGSENNLGRYSDGHAWCFTPGCGYFERAGAVALPRPLNDERRTLPPLDGTPQPLPHRGIDQATCSRFSYWVGVLAGDRAEIANYFSAEGELVAQKVRLPAKKFHWRGETRRALLFGQQLWPAGGRRVVVSEGELDAMSIAQVMGAKEPVVSLPNGAASAPAALQRNLEWLTSFDHVVLCFDQDDAGQAAVRECCEVLPPTKARIAVLPLKDANAMLLAGRAKELVAAIFEAQPPGTRR